MKLKIFSCFVLFVISTAVIYSQNKEQRRSSGIVLNKDTTNKTVFGFLPSWIYGTNPGVNIRYDLLTHLAVFSFEADKYGNLTQPQYSSWPWNDVINNANANDVKLIMTITNFNSDDIRDLMNDGNKRQNLFNNIMNSVLQIGFNGLIIDFENVYPGDDRKYAFKNFMKLLKEEFEVIPNFELSAALPAYGGGEWDFEGIAEYCNYIFVMGYDYYGSWSLTTGPSAPLTGDVFGIQKDIKEFYANVPNEKIILGVPYYGNLWDVNSGEPYTSAIRFNGNNQTTTWNASITYKDIVNDYSNYEKMFDEISNTSWLRNKQNDTTWKQIWYDDTTSLALKYDWTIEKDFGGIGIWALGYDDGRSELWNLIYNKFYKPTSIFEEEYIYSDFELSQNYPNPFNPETIISYKLPTASYARLKIFDIVGNEVAVIVNQYQQAGEYSYRFSANNKKLSSGIYFYRLEAGSFSASKKMIMIK